MVVKINTLSEKHIDNAVRLTSPLYRGAIAVLANGVGASYKYVHTAVLQSLYNVHLRALEHLKTREGGSAALPLIAPSNKTLATAHAAAIDLLSTGRSSAKKGLLTIQREVDAERRSEVVPSALLQVSRSGGVISMLSLDERYVSDNIKEMLDGKISPELLRLIARETFLGFGIPHKSRRQYAYGGQHSTKDQYDLENRSGVKVFEKNFPKIAEKHLEEDFAPLSSLLRKKLPVPSLKLADEKTR